MLPRFKQVDLILGLEDAQTSQVLNQTFNVTAKVRALTDASTAFIDRLQDQSLHLKFTKGPLFHSKYFILENKDSFRIFNGSMNLTKKATSSNHELVWVYSGKKGADPLYRAHLALFKQNFSQDSSEFLDRKIIAKLHHQDRAGMVDLLTTDLLDRVATNKVNFTPKEVATVTGDSVRGGERYELLPQTTDKIVKTIYTPKGNKRRNRQQVSEQVKKIVYQSFTPGQVEEQTPASAIYPQPMWSYNDQGKLIIRGKDDYFYPLRTDINDVDKQDVVNFVQVIKSFHYNKVRNESQQALSAFMYLMTAPLIWKIREIYRQSNFVKSPDQVPVSMVLIGRGTTGKTLLVRDYFKRFIGDHSESIEYQQINPGSSSHTNQAVRFLGDYLRSGRFVSPMIIDELNENFLHSKVSTHAIKQWSNTIKGIHNVNIFAMNHNAANRSINNLEEITKRVYYLSFEAGWLKPDQQRYEYQVLVNNTNDHIYRYVTSQLNHRLNNLSGMEESELVDDYLSQTRAIVKDLLRHFGLEGELSDIIDQNYNYKDDCNRITWKMLIRDDNFKHVSFTPGDEKQFTVSKAIFNNIKGSNFENINQTLDNYFNMFPRESGVAIYQYDNGMILDIDKFDRYVGEPLIRNYYRRQHEAETHQDQLETMLKMQKQEQEQNKQMVTNQTKVMKEMLAQMSQQKQPKDGLFSRLFHKRK